MGLPVGLQIVGRRFDDLGVLQAVGGVRGDPALGGQAAATWLTARMSHAINAFLLGFPALFSIVNPISGALIFQRGHPGRTSRRRRVRLARQVGAQLVVVMMGALWAGSYVLAFFGISLAALRVAGGLVVALTGWTC